jgi:hypothetical protein
MGNQVNGVLAFYHLKLHDLHGGSVNRVDIKVRVSRRIFRSGLDIELA